MKVYISVDMEGITGVTHWDEVEHKKPAAYIQFQERMTQEVLAACNGANDAGAKEIWVKDAHYSGRNILAERLPSNIRLVFLILSFLENLQLFILENLFAFQILLRKFLYPLTLSSESLTSLPGAAIEIKVNLKESAPYSSIMLSGSITLPFDFDIFWPFSSLTNA